MRALQGATLQARRRRRKNFEDYLRPFAPACVEEGRRKRKDKTMRLQLALNVPDIDAAVDYYGKLFGTEPHKRRDGYANFAIEEPPLKLVLFEKSWRAICRLRFRRRPMARTIHQLSARSAVAMKRGSIRHRQILSRGTSARPKVRNLGPVQRFAVRVGPVCLNNKSGLISGLSAGVRLPCGPAAR